MAEETAPAPDVPPKTEEPVKEEAATKEEATEAKEETPPPATEEKKEEPKKEAPVKSPKPTKEDIERKALEDFKLKVEEAIKAKAFVPPPPPPPPEEKKEEAAPEATKAEEEAPKPVEGEAPKTEEAKTEEAEAPKAEEPEAAKTAEVPEAKIEEEAPKEEAELKEEEVLEDVPLWGIPLLHTKGDPRTDVLLGKFLRARDFKVPQALTMLKNTILWRKSYKTDEILNEELGNDFDGLAFMFESDKEGHPVCYNVFGVLQDKELYHKVFGDDASKFIRWRVQLLEKGIQMLKFEAGQPNALLQVIDLKNAPWPAKKVRSVILGQAISLLQDNYPELVIKNVFINVPWYYSAIFSVVSPFLTQHQKNKFVVSRLGKSTEALFRFISPEKVPIQYGGFGRPNDDEFVGAEAPVTEVGVKAGEKKIIEMSVTTSDATITWDLVVLGSELSYSAEFQPEKEGGYTTIVEKTKKIPAQLDAPIRTSFKTSEPGKLVLTIDNSISRKKKSVLYRYIVKGEAPATELNA